MEYLDIHSHILPDVDDGAEDLLASLELLDMLKAQGVTAVIATPHFYPQYDSAEDFEKITNEAYKELQIVTKGKDYPKIYLGCELRYFNGISKSHNIDRFTIKGTDYLLLELSYGAPITKTVINEIMTLSENFNIILAHIERFYKLKGFKDLLKLIKDGYAAAHINSDAVMSKEEAKICEKLIKGGYVTFVASDTHSAGSRPPKIKEALDAIAAHFGKSVSNRFIINSNKLLEELEGSDYKL